MLKCSMRLRMGIVLVAVCGHAAHAGPGRIVIANDEWTLSNSAPSFTPSSAGGSRPTSHHGSRAGARHVPGLLQQLRALREQPAEHDDRRGHSLTISTGATFTAANLLANYDAVFVGGFSANNQALIDNVNGGGSVYLMGGTGVFPGGAPGEAAAWSTFLQALGMEFASSDNSISGNIGISSPHPIFNGVTSLNQNNGSSIFNDTGPDAQVLVSSGGNGRYAVYDVGVVIPLPAPAANAPAPGTCACVVAPPPTHTAPAQGREPWSPLRSAAGRG